MRRWVLRAAFFTLCLPARGFSQVPLATYAEGFEARHDRTQPIVRYTVTAHPADTSWIVEMRVRNAPNALRLRMPIWAPGAYRVVQFARAVRDLTISSGGHAVAVKAEVDSSRWTATLAGGEATIRYRIVYVTPSVPNNRSFLASTGGLVDGPGTYLYIEGSTLAPAHVRFELPDGWRIQTGLTRTLDATTFFAPSYDILIDSPVLVGLLRVWDFLVDDVPHHLAYWPKPSAVPFDTLTFMSNVRRIVDESRTIFGRLPYRDYTFLAVDGMGGGLEHLNSTTVGTPSEALARTPAAANGLIAHEFFHTWNVKRIRPAELGPFDYQHPVRTLNLWWSEGVTSYFSGAVLRRSTLTSNAAALAEFADLIALYLNNPGRTQISPERSSWTSWDAAAVNGGFSTSYYMTGQLLGELLDLRIGSATDGARGMDDLIRLLFDRYAGVRGFTSEDLLNAANEVCGCDLQSFFGQYVSGTAEFDFGPTLALAGWKVVTTREPYRVGGLPAPDTRITVAPLAGFGSSNTALGGIRLMLNDPTSLWGRAGLISGDELLELNSAPVTSRDQLSQFLEHAKIGDTVALKVRRGAEIRDISVKLEGYDVTKVALEELPSPSALQRTLRDRWLRGPVLPH